MMRATTTPNSFYLLLLPSWSADADDGCAAAFEKELLGAGGAGGRCANWNLGPLPSSDRAGVPDRILGVNYGAGHKGGNGPTRATEECARAGPAPDDFLLFRLLTGTDDLALMRQNYQDYATALQGRQAGARGGSDLGHFASEHYD